VGISHGTSHDFPLFWLEGVLVHTWSTSCNFEYTHVRKTTVAIITISRQAVQPLIESLKLSHPNGRHVAMPLFRRTAPVLRQAKSRLHRHPSRSKTKTVQSLEYWCQTRDFHVLQASQAPRPARGWPRIQRQRHRQVAGSDGGRGPLA
jgi:hypothetical protein